MDETIEFEFLSRIIASMQSMIGRRHGRRLSQRAGAALCGAPHPMFFVRDHLHDDHHHHRL
jgi:hypothetical protein